MSAPLSMAGGNSRQVAERSVRVDEAFDVRVGDSARLADTTMRLRVDAVESDSRCPVDVSCVWAGDAIVRLVVDVSSGSGETVRLHTNEAFDQEAVVGQFRIRLVTLAPPRSSGSDIDQATYIATLRISRA